MRLLLSAISALLPIGALAAPPTVEFNRDVRPILADTCFHCHGPDKARRKADLRLDTPQGAADHQVIVPGKPLDSELFQRITARDLAKRMPPRESNRRLSEAQIALIKRWIEQGAKWQAHWSLIPPQRPPLPAVRDAQAPVLNPIDRFIIARLEKEGLRPAQEASKTTLLRRVTLDLTGLPPTLDEIDRFLNDPLPDAYEKAVDRLLASPRYGERMALEWLDAARYADSNGYQSDRNRTMWPWRDWLIDALNRNLPFDQFTVDMLAGDLLPNAGVSQKVATGFHRNHMLNGEGGRIAEESRVDYVVDRVDTTATIWLGLTLGCCRCHDHKYDPFTQKEYYRLYAFFNNVPESGGVDRGGNAAPVMKAPSQEQVRRIAELTAEIAELQRKVRPLTPKLQPTQADLMRLAFVPLLRQPGALAVAGILEQSAQGSPEYRALSRKLAAARKALDDVQKSVPEVMVMEEIPKPRDSFVLLRGAYDKFGDKVTPGVPAALPPLHSDAPTNRLALARWLVHPNHPLTARVTVNRAWQIFFGAGLVKTPEDFGVQGEPPTHPELLDWLATEFVRTGWDVKSLHRLIVTSATYRQSSSLTRNAEHGTRNEQSSVPSSELRAPSLIDPDNRLLWRGPRLRLSAYAIRDQALAAAGLLSGRIGGPPVKPYQPAGIWEEMTFGFIKYQQDTGESLYRRSLYTFWRRTVAPTTLFDTASRQVCTVRPDRTNTPLHALILLNDTTYVEASRKLAERILKEANEPAERITLAFRVATSRPPRPQELQILQRALARFRAQYRADPEAARQLLSIGESPRDPKLDAVELAAQTALAELILNLDEAITRE